MGVRYLSEVFGRTWITGFPGSDRDGGPRVWQHVDSLFDRHGGCEHDERIELRCARNQSGDEQDKPRLGRVNDGVAEDRRDGLRGDGVGVGDVSGVYEDNERLRMEWINDDCRHGAR